MPDLGIVSRRSEKYSLSEDRFAPSHGSPVKKNSGQREEMPGGRRSMATGPIETHLHRSFNWENAAPGSPNGTSGAFG